VGGNVQSHNYQIPRAQWCFPAIYPGNGGGCYSRQLWTGASISVHWLRWVFQLFQDVDNIHGLGGMVSMAATGASGVATGNFRIFENFLEKSGAKVHLDTEVNLLRFSIPF
jgi:hypothetical protein